MTTEILRPTLASEGLQMIKEGKTIEIENKYVYAFLRCIENWELNISLHCRVNEDNKGYSIISKIYK